MSTIDLVDIDHREAARAIPPFDPERDSISEMRGRLLASFAMLMPSQGTRREEYRIPGVLDAQDVRVLVYRPAEPGSAAGAILYIHGGGFISGSPDMCDAASTALADAHGVPVIAVDYRLAPEAPFPLPLHDCFAALAWISSHPPELDVPSDAPIVVLGDSAGGGLAAALALLARERRSRMPDALLLRYPMLDHRTGSAEAPVDNPSTGEFIWTRAANRFAWHAMQGQREVPDAQLGLFSPARASTLRDLPPTFIAVGSLDLFLDENLDFARRLMRDEVPTELHVYPGGIHSFDLLPGSLGTSLKLSLSQAIDRALRR